MTELSDFPIGGILLVNKPQGLTSNAVLQKLKRFSGFKKAGHTGSLDPLATGMLPICFGEATKVCEYLLDADKCYETTGLLGIKTDTADSTGTIIAQCESISIQPAELEAILDTFRGESHQIPSMYSALKYQGTPLYKLARQGLSIERSARTINVSRLILDNFQENTFSLTITCSKGTYIRNIVEDIGDKLGTGAHVIRLHRKYTAGFENYPMYTLEALLDKSRKAFLDCLIPMDKAIQHLPALYLSDVQVLAIQQGRVVQTLDETSLPLLRLYNEAGQFMGLVRQENGDIRAKRLISTQF